MPIGMPVRLRSQRFERQLPATNGDRLLLKLAKGKDVSSNRTSACRTNPKRTLVKKAAGPQRYIPPTVLYITRT
jgi:hypothetical protein